MNGAIAAVAAWSVSFTAALAQPALPTSIGMTKDGAISIVPAAALADATPGPYRLPFVKSAKPGDKLAVDLVTLSLATNAGASDATYDVRVLGPSGSIHRGLTRSGGKIGPAPGFTMMEGNRRDGFVFTFLDDDPAGTYRVDAVVHDRVSKRDIPLSAQIELKK